MRTTLVIEDDLYRRVKAKAALEGKKVTQLVEDGLRTVLGLTPAPPTGPAPQRLSLPIIRKQAGQVALFSGMSQDEIHRRISELGATADQPDGTETDEASV